MAGAEKPRCRRLPVWPVDLEAARGGIRQEEEQPWVVRRGVAAVGAGATQWAGLSLERSTRPLGQMQANPRHARRVVARVVSIEPRRAGVVAHHDVRVAIVVEVGEGGASAHFLRVQ